MEFERAKQLLRLHSRCDPDTDHPLWTEGFLGSLDPYRGLNEDNFHEVMAAIVAIAPQVIGQPLIDRQVMDALWTLSMLSRAWGLEPDGMLQRNHFLNAEDTERFAGWVEAIEWAVFMLLDADGTHPTSAIIEEALASYRQVTDREFPPAR